MKIAVFKFTFSPCNTWLAAAEAIQFFRSSGRELHTLTLMKYSIEIVQHTVG